MKRAVLVLAVAMVLVGMLAVPAFAADHEKYRGDTGVIKGYAYDENAPALGEIKYLFNQAGYHLWFTVSADIGPYTAGHSYHNIYKYYVEDDTGWATLPVPNPDRLPYNAGGTEGAEPVYYKSWDITAEEWVVGSE